jgi:hypothetical protein
MEKAYLCHPMLHYVDVCAVPKDLGFDLAEQIEDNLSAKRTDLEIAYGSQIVENKFGLTGKYCGCGLDFDNFKVYSDELLCEVIPSAVVSPEKYTFLEACVLPKLYHDRELTELTPMEVKDVFNESSDIARSMIEPLKRLTQKSFGECGVDSLESAYEIRLSAVCSDDPVLHNLPKKFNIQKMLDEGEHCGLEDLVEIVDARNNTGQKWKIFGLHREGVEHEGIVRGACLRRDFGPNSDFPNGGREFYTLAFNSKGNSPKMSYLAEDAFRASYLSGLYYSTPKAKSRCLTCPD